MNLRGRIPVEPLSEKRTTEIERRVVAAAPSQPGVARGRWWPVLAAACAFVLAGGLGWKLGTASVDRPAVDPEAAAEATIELPIRVDTMERATVDIGDATITSDPRTKLVITRPGGGVLVAMARGKVELEVGKRGARPPLVVRAGDTDVIVVGTHFTVDYGDGTGTAVVEVMEGVVNVVRRNEPVVPVAAGEAFTAPRGRIARTELHAAGTPARGEHETLAPDVVARGDRRGSGSVATATASNPKKVTQYVEDFHAALRAQPIAPAFDVQESDPALAIAKHYVTASGRGAEASRALYSIAVLQLLQLRDAPRALATLDAYLNRFAHKNEHADALWLRVRILCARTFDEKCRHAAEVYAREVPAGTKAGLAEKISATVE